MKHTHQAIAVIITTYLSVHTIVCTADAASDQGRLAEVLGSVADWKIAPGAYVLSGTPGQTILKGPSGQVAYLESSASRPAPSECLISFRLKPAAGTVYLNVQMGCAERADKTPQALTFGVSATPTQKYIGYGASVQGGKSPPSLSGYHYLEAVSDRSLGWSEEMRKSIEAQIAAAPKIADTLMTIRCTAEKGRFRCWLNGRFVAELVLDPDVDPSGIIKVTVSANSELVSARLRSLTPVPSLFEPLSIAGNLNAATLNGAKVDRASLPGTPVNGVPFEFPNLAANGDDHIDVGQSWTRFGALPGYFPSHVGTFGGRWVSADRLDPARICMYIPKGRYKALHLIAVADGRKDSVPIVSAQFYRPDAGHPINFEGSVPTAKGDAGKASAVPIKLAGGKNAKLYHVVVPLDPDAFSWFTDLPRIGMEITKQVQFYRAYPDPLEYSWHGAGLPSSVQIYAMTLERAGMDADLQPDQFGHFWTAPATPSYSVNLRNLTGAATTAKLHVTTKSYDGKDTTKQETTVSLPSGGAPVKAPIALKPTRYGLHEIQVTVSDGSESATYKRSFAFLHPDTRDKDIWEAGRGSVFGFWAPGGAHDTPTLDKELPLMAAAGAETSLADYDRATPEIRAMAEKYRFISEPAFSGGAFYYNAFIGDANAPKWNPADPEGSGKALVEAIRKLKNAPSATCRPTYLPFFPEPLVGMVTGGVWPTHYGEEFTLPPEDQKTFKDMEAKFLAGARAVRKEWPDVKLLLPYGDPNYTAIFLRLSPEARELIDGCAVDLPGFERLPEQQAHQVSFQRLCPIMKDIRQYKPDPYLVVVEGTSISSKDFDTGDEGQADVCTRGFLTLMGYGINRFESSDAPFDCANYWGENHYGGGYCTRKPVAMPKLAYVDYATMTRHLNRANFTKYIPTGSTSTYCEQFKHYKTGKLIHVLWTIRGKRTVHVKAAPGSTLEIYDRSDNVTTLKEKDGVVTFTIDNGPRFLEGLTADAAITLGESNHSDSMPAKVNERLGNLGVGWKLVEKEDLEYAKNKPLHIERFLGKMDAKAVDAPKEQGGKSLAIHLQKQDKDRGVMPFYTTLEPKRPINIPGKASHLGLWVHAASDWGRVVYSVRDAKGERWISVGTKEDWNCDDIHCWSAFCFDGWRYLRFQLPSNAPYDCFRERGTSWWGSYDGDGIVDLPLKLEKVIVERRPKVICGNELMEAKPDDVLLGDLYAEYASAVDKGDEAVRLSKVRMPLPPGVPELANPIADLAKAGVGAPPKVLKVTDPVHQYDGTRCHLHFDLVPAAKSYSVWVSPYADGTGALQLGTGWTESGKMIEGLRPDIEFYAFVIYTDTDGKSSKPSAPLKFKLKDRFGYK